MLIPGNVRIHLAVQPVSLLKSIDGLCAEVQARFGDDPMSGHLFVFVNKSHTGLKLLYWDHGGFVLTYKRLERGCFQMPVVRGDRAEMTFAQLTALLEGIDLSRARKIPLWSPPRALDKGTPPG